MHRQQRSGDAVGSNGKLKQTAQVAFQKLNPR
jgi:hypothetical protein